MPQQGQDPSPGDKPPIHSFLKTSPIKQEALADLMMAESHKCHCNPARAGDEAQARLFLAGESFSVNALGLHMNLAQALPPGQASRVSCTVQPVPLCMDSVFTAGGEDEMAARQISLWHG